MMRFVLVITTLASALSTSSPEELFQKFKVDFKRNYFSKDEEAHRFEVFQRTLRVIDERNSQSSSEVHGITRFADLTQVEFETSFLDRLMSQKIQSLNGTLFKVPPYTGSASSADYTTTQTTKIKDQGSCGSCWAHACAQQVESDGMRLLKNPPTALSVQQLVSCDRLNGDGNKGCAGGLQEPGFTWIAANGGLVSEADYPYVGTDKACDTVGKKALVTVVGTYGFIGGIGKDVKVTEADFSSYVLATGTLSIGVDASAWNTYTSGIMTNCGAGTNINHAVQIVGVDNSASGFWKIRNSWSAIWGEQGFIRVGFGKNTCGLATEGGSFLPQVRNVNPMV